MTQILQLLDIHRNTFFFLVSYGYFKKSIIFFFLNAPYSHSPEMSHKILMGLLQGTNETKIKPLCMTFRQESFSDVC